MIGRSDADCPAVCRYPMRTTFPKCAAPLGGLRRAGPGKTAGAYTLDDATTAAPDQAKMFIYEIKCSIPPNQPKDVGSAQRTR